MSSSIENQGSVLDENAAAAILLSPDEPKSREIQDDEVEKVGFTTHAKMMSIFNTVNGDDTEEYILELSQD